MLDPTSQQIEITPADAGAALSAAGLFVGESQVSSENSQLRSVPLKISVDHRESTARSIFIPLRGTRFDGHSVIPSLDPNSAGWIVAQSGSIASATIPTFFVSDTRSAWSCLCARAMGNPERKLKVLGVTGTNGKTSTVWYIRQILRLLGVKSVSFGTLGCFIEDEFYPSTHTTPDPPLFYRMLALAVQRGCTVLEMEVSSHAIAQNRLFGVRFDGAAFTSFSRDHLDFHKTMEEYLETKMRLFEVLAKPQAFFAVHSALRDSFVSRPKICQQIAYYTYKDSKLIEKNTIESLASIRTKDSKNWNVEVESAGKKESGPLAVVGGFALENFLAAKLLVSGVLGEDFSAEKWPSVNAVPGRLELVRPISRVGTGVTAVVDYAHTPDALEKAILCLRNSYNDKKLLTVFGCGGDRDRGKRPEMGSIAANLSERVIVTSDNPRTEEPAVIIDEIMAGVPVSVKNKVQTIVDRGEAISTALKSATHDWIVLIAGKGHEDYQEVGNQKFPFDDRKIARAVLESL